MRTCSNVVGVARTDSVSHLLPNAANITFGEESSTTAWPIVRNYRLASSSRSGSSWTVSTRVVRPDFDCFPLSN